MYLCVIFKVTKCVGKQDSNIDIGPRDREKRCTQNGIEKASSFRRKT